MWLSLRHSPCPTSHQPNGLFRSRIPFVAPLFPHQAHCPFQSKRSVLHSLVRDLSSKVLLHDLAFAALRLQKHQSHLGLTDHCQQPAEQQELLQRTPSERPSLQPSAPLPRYAPIRAWPSYSLSTQHARPLSWQVSPPPQALA